MLRKTWEQGQLSLPTAQLSLEQVGRGTQKAGVITADATFSDATGSKKTFALHTRAFPFCTKPSLPHSPDCPSSWSWVDGGKFVLILLGTCESGGIS